MNNIAETREKCKFVINKIPRDVLIIIVLVLSASASFGLGYLAAPVPEIDCALSQSSGTAENEKGSASTMTTSATGQGQYLASKNGTKYYLPSCAGANKISDANKIWFATAAAAQAAGYSPAANCPGL